MPWAKIGLDFFISYRYEDRYLAGRVAQLLSASKQDFFLAHEDIDPSDDFEDKVKERIEACTAVIAIVTPSYADAAYPNQEVGMALGLKKPIIPFWFPEVKSSKLGFLRAVNAIQTSEQRLSEAVSKAVDFAEQKILANYVSSPDGPIEQQIDAFLEPRREPYYRVLVRPQGLYEIIHPSAENDDWLIANRPQYFANMDWKPTPRGMSFTYPGPYRGLVYNTGEICFGQAVPRVDGIVLEAFVLIIGNVVEYARKIYEKYGWNQQQHGLVRIEFKIGHSHGETLKTGNSSGWVGQYSTDQSMVTVEEAVSFESLSDPKPVLAGLLIRTCRAFGRSMSGESAKGWVAISIRG
jgi:hypothetical protein